MAYIKDRFDLIMEAVGDEQERTVVVGVAIRAGVLWRCINCGHLNTAGRLACDQCHINKHAIPPEAKGV